MGVPISNVTRRVVYEASGTGPYSFTFEILAAGDVAVYKDDALLTLTTDYTVTINANGTGYITLVASPTGADQIAIVGNRTIQRTTDFVTGGDFFANTVNDELDQQTIFAQQNAEGLQRALSAPQTDPTTIDMVLPRASVRANKTLAFDSDGNPTTGEQIGDYRGNWATGTAYNKRDLIKDTSNSNVYICTVAHTSSGSQPISTNTDAAKWDLIVDAVTAGEAQIAAEAAQAAAEDAQAAAETAETNAETAATAASSSASAASTSASNAATSATNASNSATAASGSASTASTQATNAASSATAAASSASAASSSATSAANSATSASTSASNASTSATNAASSASAASTSASAASTSATNSANSATASASSATSSASSATASAASAAAAAASYDSFDDRYLGVKSSAPSVDNDGNALVNGALYFDSTLGAMRVYNTTTSSWATIQQGVTNTELERHSVRPSLLLDFANTKQLDPRITFTRASSAAFYDGKTTAKAEENLFLYSQELDNAVWSKNGITVTANTVASPDGTTTAETITANAVTGGSNIRLRKDETINDTFTFSVFAKAGTHSVICLQSVNSSSSNNWAGAVFDLSAGTMTQSASGTSATLVSTGITSVGNSWYRCSITVTLTTYGSPANQIVLFNNTTGNSTSSFGFNPSVTFAGTETVYLWGAQLEQRSAVTAYTATTTERITNYIPALQTAAAGVARFDHNPTTGESLGLLIEEQRTNLLTYSDDFSDAAWIKTRSSIGSNVIIAPDGTLTGDKLIEDTNASNSHLVAQLFSETSGTVYTYSVYVKPAERSFFALSQGTRFAYFDLSAGSVGLQANAVGSISSVGNGWYRCSIVYTSVVTGSVGHEIQIATSAASGGVIYTGDGYSGIYIWGAQLEAGAFPTSYIPTTSAQVTRSADAASMTGTNFSSWYRADEGTLYADFTPLNAMLQNKLAVSVNDGSTANIVAIGTRVPSASFGGQIRVANGTTVSVGSFGAGSATQQKAAFAIKNADYALSYNGGAVATDTSALPVSISTLYIGGLTSVGQTLYLSRIAYYPARLTNAELVGLTS